MAEAAERVDSDEHAGGRGRPLWSGTVSFGLVSIPVTLVPGVRHTRVALRMLGDGGTPLSRRYASATDDKEIAAEHIVRGYEIRPGKFVVVEDAELEAIAPEKSRDIDLRRFVKLDEIDPVYFDRPYYLVAGSGSNKAYRLLAEVMEKTRRAGIATFVMRGKEYLVALLAEGGVLRAATLRFADEVRTVKEIGLPAKKKASRAALSRVEKALKKLAGAAVKPAELVDERDRRLVELIARKQRAGEVVRNGKAKDPEDAVVIDLIERIKASLGATARSKGRKPARRAA